MNHTMRSLSFSVAVVLMTALSAQAMNLKQKKYMKEYSGQMKTAAAPIEKDCGCKPEMVFNWAEVDSKDKAMSSYKVVEDVSEKLVGLCKEGFKKEVCDKVKKVDISYSGGGDPSVSFSGTTMSYKYGMNGGVIVKAGGYLERALEENL